VKDAKALLHQAALAKSAKRREDQKANTKREKNRRAGRELRFDYKSPANKGKGYNLDKFATKASIRRLARRGGIKRLGTGDADGEDDNAYLKLRDLMKDYTRGLVRRAMAMTESAKRKTVTIYDVVNVLRASGRSLYGYN
jgi:histone H3/H4